MLSFPFPGLSRSRRKYSPGVEIVQVAETATARVPCHRLDFVVDAVVAATVGGGVPLAALDSAPVNVLILVQTNRAQPPSTERIEKCYYNVPSK